MDWIKELFSSSPLNTILFIGYLFTSNFNILPNYLYRILISFYGISYSLSHYNLLYSLLFLGVSFPIPIINDNIQYFLLFGSLFYYIYLDLEVLEIAFKNLKITETISPKSYTILFLFFNFLGFIYTPSPFYIYPYLINLVICFFLFQGVLPSSFLFCFISLTFKNSILLNIPFYIALLAHELPILRFIYIVCHMNLDAIYVEQLNYLNSIVIYFFTIRILWYIYQQEDFDQ